MAELDAALKRPEVQAANFSPAVVRRLLMYLQPHDTSPRYPHIKRFATVGGPLPAKDKVAAVTHLTPGFAMTYSATGIGTMAYCQGAEILVRPESAGKPVANRKIEIRDGDRICEAGEIGEIVATKPNGPRLYPDDLGYLDEDGYLYVTGRKAGIVCRNGVNFTTDRARNAVLGLSGIYDAVAISRQDPAVGDRVYVLAEGALPEDLDTKLSQVLPRTERPDGIFCFDKLPLNQSEKYDLRACEDLLDQALKGQ